MPRLIFKCPYIKGGTSAACAHLENYVQYMATRNGVERIDPGRDGWQATKRQKEMIKQILRDFPLSRGIFEYEDYLVTPTRSNASEFITRALEDNYDRIAKMDNYLNYIATRPRAQRIGSHGLFTGAEDSLVLAQIAEVVAMHPGNVWLPIISLRREDAARLGYDKADEWKALLSKYAMDMAEAMKIPWEDFRWYAAFHDEAHHPHVHMVCFSADPSKGFLTKQGIAQIKSGLAKEIFRQDLTELYQKQTQRRNELNTDAQAALRGVIEEMQSGNIQNAHIEEWLQYLADRLRFLSGKKQYGYLKAPLKAVVDEIVDELAKDPRVASAYNLWYELREDVLRTYKDDLPERLPLSEQKEFKRLKNLVIEEAVKLGQRQQVFHPDDIQDDDPAEQAEAASSFAGEQAKQTKGHSPDESNAGQGFAQYALGKKYRDGQGVERNIQKAVELFTLAAKQGNSFAAFALGKMFLSNDASLPRDEAAALNWITYASERGNQFAQCYLGKLLLKGADGIPQDTNAALRWLCASVDQGNVYAEYALAMAYLKGKIVPKDALKALELLRHASSQDNQFAQYQLGKMMLQGEEAPKDVATAVHWLTVSAMHGNQYAQYTLGKLYLLGKDVEKDKDSAAKWFQMAADQGNEYAQYFLKHMDDPVGQSTAAAVITLLHSLANIFREQSQFPTSGIVVAVDRKLLRKIKAKKIAQGHKADDHEPKIGLQ
ncbi:MobP3 family relaxase [Youxingia wuxianensis]|uniref:SEL1-like repeat protein n=1 Tax=Youxingia wuxianensis TaxID=2763678 RepID=A0A926ERA0_9FIRM|nr:MobP3 family relaxase [Youxingia wuxianensis]MBC8584845.1 SEL1-like repeat protein [Youxingia wuxianensis]